MVSVITCIVIGIILTIASVQDIKTRTISNIFPVLILLTIVAEVVTSRWISPDPGLDVFKRISFGCVFTVLLILITLFLERMFRREMLGGGDIKILGALSFFTTLSNILYILLIACIVGGLYGLISKKNFPFVPFITVGYAVIYSLNYAFV